MPDENLITILEQIRDIQKRQVENFESAMQSQGEALQAQKSGRRVILAAIIMPWLMIVVLLILLFNHPMH